MDACRFYSSKPIVLSHYNSPDLHDRCARGLNCQRRENSRRVAFEVRLAELPQREVFGPVLHVGVQPFGSEGYSGTGPKAGGPLFLHRFAVERTRTFNIAAMGGKTELPSGE